MIPITITLHVDAAAAVRAGHCEAGPHRVIVTRADFDTLTIEQRDTLAHHLDRIEDPRAGADVPRWGDPLAHWAEPIPSADFPTLVHLLNVRREVMRRQDEQAAEQRRVEAANREAIGLVIEVVDPSWLPAWESGRMPPHETEAILARHVFAPLDAVSPRYSVADLDCTAMATHLDREQVARLAALQSACSSTAWEIEPRRAYDPAEDRTIGTFALVRGVFAGVEIEAAYPLDAVLDPIEQRASDEHAIALQRSISALVRRVSSLDAAAESRRLRRWARVPHPPTPSADVTALAAAVLDPVIWAALANVRTEIAGSGVELPFDHA